MANNKERLTALARQLEGLSLEGTRVLLGLDGFVDEVVHVVDRRHSAEAYTRLETLREYGTRLAQASGYSCNIEMVTVQKKLGGNGTILANALVNFGPQLTYMGALGLPAPDTVFHELTSRCRAISLADPGHTDAVEFFDGKIISSKLSALAEVTWPAILDAVGAGGLREMLAESDLVGFLNWTMLPHMSDIWRHLLEEMLPLPQGKGGLMFFDLADPAKRRPEDVREALGLVARFAPHFTTVLGLNEKEARGIAATLGLEDSLPVPRLAAALYGEVGVHCLTIHPLRQAVAVTPEGLCQVDGPYCEKPRLTTGAGDNYNAGFLLGLLGGLSTEDALLLGVATSGYYVRQCHSPNGPQLAAFLRQWAGGQI